MGTRLFSLIMILALAVLPGCSDDSDDNGIAAEELNSWSVLEAGGSHSLGIKSDGTLWAWGGNTQGQLGLGNWRDRFVPEQVGTETGWVSVSAGGSHSMGIKSDGTLWTWGMNIDGQLGKGSRDSKRPGNTVPARPVLQTGWAAVAAGQSHSLALTSGGELWVCGNNEQGQLGIGTFENRTTFTRVGTETDWRSVSAGGEHSLGIKTDGTLWAWGANDAGQLGDGTFEGSSIPVLVDSDLEWSLASAGGGHSLALIPEGDPWAWGDNTRGQLGDGTTEQKNSPVFIDELPAGEGPEVEP